MVGGFDTQRLHLRPLGEGDEALYCHLYTDPELMRHIGTPLSAEAARRSFGVACRQARRDGAPAQRWVVAERGLPDGIGLLGLVPDEGVADTAEVGLMLLADRRQRGLAAEAIGAVADRVFDPGAADGSHAPAALDPPRAHQRGGGGIDAAAGVPAPAARERRPARVALATDPRALARPSLIQRECPADVFGGCGKT